MGAQASSGPRVRVAALMLLDGRVVTVRHRAGAATYHLLPGGGVEYRETLGDALEREILEETGLQARIGDPILVNDTIDPTGTRHLVNITFLAEVIGGAITDAPRDSRVEGVDLVAPDELTSLDLRPPIAGALAEYLSSDNAPCAQYLGSLFAPGAR